MIGNRQVKTLISICIISALVLAGILWSKHKSLIPAQSNAAQANSPASESREDNGNDRRLDNHSPVEKRAAIEKPEQWRTIAKGTSLPLVNPASLTLNQGVIELLDLTPTEWKELNADLETFLDRLRAAEKKHAYVLAGSDGSEQIVVAPFDRGPMVKKFRETVAGQLGNNVADFCAEQMLYDSALALGNSEVRLYIETGDNGRDIQVISRGVHRRNPSGDPKWDGDAAPPFVTRMPAKKDFGIRYRHLSTAAKKLPRKTEPPK